MGRVLLSFRLLRQPYQFGQRTIHAPTLDLRETQIEPGTEAIAGVDRKRVLSGLSRLFIAPFQAVEIAQRVQRTRGKRLVLGPSLGMSNGFIQLQPPVGVVAVRLE